MKKMTLWVVTPKTGDISAKSPRLVPKTHLLNTFFHLVLLTWYIFWSFRKQAIYVDPTCVCDSILLVVVSQTRSTMSFGIACTPRHSDVARRARSVGHHSTNNTDWWVWTRRWWYFCRTHAEQTFHDVRSVVTACASRLVNSANPSTRPGMGLCWKYIPTGKHAVTTAAVVFVVYQVYTWYQ